MKHKIKITQRDIPQYSTIELDGIDISGYVRIVNLSLVAGEMPHVTLELVITEIEIPDEIEAIITIIRKEDEE